MSKKIKKQTIEEMLAETDGLMLGSDESLLYTRIPFHIPDLDKLTGGGIPRKRLSLFTGPTNAGKSFLASQVVVGAQKEGGSAAWIDLELSWDAKWMQKCGVDTNSILVAQPTTGEEAFDLIRKMMVNQVDIIVLDSVAGLVPTAVQEEDFSYNPMAWQARFVNQSLPKLIPFLKYDSAFIMINQLRSALGPVALDNMPGGMGQTFWSHFLLHVRRDGWIEEKGEKVGFDMNIRCKKSKVGGLPYQSCSVPFRLEGGFDPDEMAIRMGIEKGYIKQRGPWYAFGDDKAQGMNGLREFFMQDAEKLAMLRKKLA